MASPKFELLVGNTFKACCKNPFPKKKKNIISLIGNASCELHAECCSEELESIKIKYSQWTVNETNTLQHPKRLECIKCNCKENKEALHKKHTGKDKVKKFKVFRINDSPALCFKTVEGRPEKCVELIEEVSSI